MEPLHLEYNDFQNLSSNPGIKQEAIQQIKNGRSYTTTIDGIAYSIGVDEDNELIIIK